MNQPPPADETFKKLTCYQLFVTNEHDDGTSDSRHKLRGSFEAFDDAPAGRGYSFFGCATLDVWRVEVADYIQNADKNGTGKIDFEKGRITGFKNANFFGDVEAVSFTIKDAVSQVRTDVKHTLESLQAQIDELEKRLNHLHEDRLIGTQVFHHQIVADTGDGAAHAVRTYRTRFPSPPDRFIRKYVLVVSRYDEIYDGKNTVLTLVDGFRPDGLADIRLAFTLDPVGKKNGWRWGLITERRELTAAEAKDYERMGVIDVSFNVEPDGVEGAVGWVAIEAYDVWVG